MLEGKILEWWIECALADPLPKRTSAAVVVCCTINILKHHWIPLYDFHRYKEKVC